MATHPVELLACAIAEKEGWHKPGTIPAVRNNPGDLRFAGQLGAVRPPGATKPPAGTPEPIALFVSPAAGVAALFRQVWLQVAQGQTVRAVIAQWAPPNENDTAKYLADVLAWTGLPADVPVLQLIPPLVKL